MILFGNHKIIFSILYNKKLNKLLVYFTVVYLIFPVTSYAATVEINKKLITNQNYSLILHDGAQMLQDSGNEDVLEMYDTAYADLKLTNRLSAKKGAIVFWVKPRWLTEDKKSHTLLSSHWSEKDKSYFTITQGWWEPAGKNRLYFILSNQDYFHCSTPTRLESDTWTMITVTWKSGKDGYCGIYINDEKKIIYKLNININRLPIDKMVLGNDSAIFKKSLRNSDALFRNVRFFKKSLSHTSIYNSYQRQIKLNPYLLVNIWNWIDSDKKLKQGSLTFDAKNEIEPRIIFDEGFMWALSKQNTDRILKRINDAGFNVYIPSVWHGRGAYYPNSVSHIEKNIKNRIKQGDDPLAYLLKKAHEKNIEVHASFTVMNREDDNYPEYYDKGTPKNAYNSHLPRFRDFIVRLVQNLASRYPIDGINLDYIRTMGLCDSHFCKSDYRKKYNFSLDEDYVNRFKQSDAMKRIEKWQDNSVLDIVSRVSNEVHKINPNIKISVDSLPRGGNQRTLDGRDSIRWANEDLVDIILNMDYSKMVDVNNITKSRRLLINPDKLITLFANYEIVDNKAISRSDYIIKKYINLVRTRWKNSGIAFYLYNKLNDAQIKMLKQESFKYKVKSGW